MSSNSEAVNSSLSSANEVAVSAENLKLRLDTLKTLLDVLEMLQFELILNQRANPDLLKSLKKNIHSVLQYTDAGRKHSLFLERCFNIGEGAIPLEKQLNRLKLCQEFIAYSLYEVQADLAKLEDLEVHSKNPYSQSIEELLLFDKVVQPKKTTENAEKILYVLQDLKRPDQFGICVIAVAIHSNTTCTVGAGEMHLNEFETHNPAVYGKDKGAVLFPPNGKGFFYMADSLPNWADEFTYKLLDKLDELEGYSFIVDDQGIFKIQNPYTKEYFAPYDKKGNLCTQFREVREKFRVQREEVRPRKENLAVNDLHARYYTRYGQKMDMRRETKVVLWEFKDFMQTKKEAHTSAQKRCLSAMNQLVNSFLEYIEKNTTMSLEERHQLLLEIYAMAVELDHIETAANRKPIWTDKAIKLLNIWAKEEAVDGYFKIKSAIELYGKPVTVYDTEKKTKKLSSVINMQAMGSHKKALTTTLAFREIVMKINAFHYNHQEREGKIGLHHIADENKKLALPHIDKDGATILERFIAAGDLESVQFLAKQDAHMANIPDRNGKTALDHMINQRNVEMIAAFAAEGVQLTAEIIQLKDDHGQTILHYAAARDNKELFYHLIRQGAQRDVKDTTGKIPLDYAGKNIRKFESRRIVMKKIDDFLRFRETIDPEKKDEGLNEIFASFTHLLNSTIKDVMEEQQEQSWLKLCLESFDEFPFTSDYYRVFNDDAGKKYCDSLFFEGLLEVLKIRANVGLRQTPEYLELMRRAKIRQDVSIENINKFKSARVLLEKFKIFLENRKTWDPDETNENYSAVQEAFEDCISMLHNSRISPEQRQREWLDVCLKLSGSDAERNSEVLFFLESLLEMLAIEASDALKRTPEYQYLMYGVTVREYIRKTASQTKESWQQLSQAMRSFDDSVRHLNAEDRREAYEAGNSQLEEILLPQADSRKAKVKTDINLEKIEENGHRKLRTFQEKMKAKGIEGRKPHIAAGMLLGAVLIVASVVVIVIVPLAAFIFKKGHNIFEKYKKKFDEAPNAAAMEMPITDVIRATESVRANITKSEPIAVSVEADDYKLENEPEKVTVGSNSSRKAQKAKTKDENSSKPQFGQEEAKITENLARDSVPVLIPERSKFPPVVVPDASSSASIPVDDMGGGRVVGPVAQAVQRGREAAKRFASTPAPDVKNQYRFNAYSARHDNPTGELKDLSQGIALSPAPKEAKIK